MAVGRLQAVPVIIFTGSQKGRKSKGYSPRILQLSLLAIRLRDTRSPESRNLRRILL